MKARIFCDLNSKASSFQLLVQRIKMIDILMIY